ncbi:MAG: hypothetical protein AB7P01_18105 [Bacteroidia bacterium]
MPWFDNVFGTGLSLYGMSYVVRYLTHKIFRYDLNLIKIKEHELYQLKAKDELFKTLIEFDAYAKAQGIQLSVVYLPVIHEIQNKEANEITQSLITQLKERGIPTFDLTVDASTAIANENIYNYYYPIDMHPNAKGYAIFAKLIAEKKIFKPLTEQHLR